MGGPNWQLSATVAALVLMAPFVARGRGGMAPFERGTMGSETAAREGRPPIILVPGLAASKLMVALDEDYDYAAGKAAGCGQGNQAPGEFELTWMSLKEVRNVRCFTEKLGLVFQESDGGAGPETKPVLARLRDAVLGRGRKKISVASKRGVSVRPHDFGGLDGMTSMLSAFGRSFSVDKMSTLVKTFEAKGWRRGETLFGAPYDWRYAPAENQAVTQTFRDNLTALVERSVQTTGQKAVIVAHSMGGLYVTNFLLRQSEAWKAEYLSAFVTMSAPYGGSQRVVKSLTVGDNGGFAFVPRSYFLEMQRTSTSGLWLLPRPRVWGADTVVLETPGRNYTADMARDILLDAGMASQSEYFGAHIQDLDYWAGAKTLGVRTLCLRSTGVRTPSSLVIDANLADLGRSGDKVSVRTRWGRGDGVVNENSMRACDQFADRSIEYEGLSHRKILSSKKVVEDILSEVSFAA